MLIHSRNLKRIQQGHFYQDCCCLMSQLRCGNDLDLPFVKPTFGDFQWAAGFKDDDDVRDYFRKKAKVEAQEDKIKESLTAK